MRRILVALIVLAPSALAQSFQVSLPLQGYYRVGQYMPVRVTGTQGEMLITASGAVPTRVLGGGGVPETIAPLLMTTGNATEVIVTINGESVKAGPLRVIGDDERLVGITEGNQAFAETLFPGKKLITVPIDSYFPNSMAPLAWDALDAAVMDRFSPTLTVSPDDVLANGTIVAVKGGQPPPGNWTWAKRAEYWVFDDPLHGPSGTEIDLQNYAPSFGLEPQESLPTRQLVVIGAALFALLVIGSALLLRSRTSVVVVSLLSLATASLAFVFQKRDDAKEINHATIQILHETTQQIDNWRYVRSWRHPAVSEERANSLIYPMLASESQIESLALELRCRPDGMPETMHLVLPPHNTMAWLRRAIRGDGMQRAQIAPAKITPFTPLLDEKYLSPTVKQLGDDLYDDGAVLEAK